MASEPNPGSCPYQDLHSPTKISGCHLLSLNLKRVDSKVIWGNVFLYSGKAQSESHVTGSWGLHPPGVHMSARDTFDPGSRHLYGDSGLTAREGLFSFPAS